MLRILLLRIWFMSIHRHGMREHKNNASANSTRQRWIFSLLPIRKVSPLWHCLVSAVESECCVACRKPRISKVGVLVRVFPNKRQHRRFSPLCRNISDKRPRAIFSRSSSCSTMPKVSTCTPLNSNEWSNKIFVDQPNWNFLACCL